MSFLHPFHRVFAVKCSLDLSEFAKVCMSTENDRQHKSSQLRSHQLKLKEQIDGRILLPHVGKCQINFFCFHDLSLNCLTSFTRKCFLDI